METIQAISTFLLLCGSLLALYFLDKKYNLGLYSYPDSKSEWNDFFWGSSNTKMNETLAEKQNEINDLKERVQVLEKIVTDPAEQLKQKIDAL